MFDGSFVTSLPPRTFVVSNDDIEDVNSTLLTAVGVGQLRLRDQLDFTVDFTGWLAANGNGILSAALWSLAANSPKAPVIAGQGFTPSGRVVAVISPAAGAVVGDAYYLDVMITVGAKVAQSADDFDMPVRRLVRQLHVVLVNG